MRPSIGIASPFRPARVAGAVPLLLVAEGDRRRHVQDRGGRAAHQAVALLGVGLHDRALLRRERPRLQQDRVGDRHLADVVQRRRVLEPLAELRVHADVFGQQHREAPDALDVRAGVLVAELDRHRQALDGLRLRDLELRESAFELAGAVLDLVFERHPAALAEVPAERDRRSTRARPGSRRRAAMRPPAALRGPPRRRAAPTAARRAALRRRARRRRGGRRPGWRCPPPAYA